MKGPTLSILSVPECHNFEMQILQHLPHENADFGGAGDPGMAPKSSLGAHRVIGGLVCLLFVVAFLRCFLRRPKNYENIGFRVEGIAKSACRPMLILAFVGLFLGAK